MANPGVGRRADKLLSFPRTNHQLLKARISQDDLIEERLLAKAAARACDALEKHRNYIRGCLEAGVPVEDGYHTAYLSHRHRKAKRVKSSDFIVLVVR